MVLVCGQADASDAHNRPIVPVSGLPAGFRWRPGPGSPDAAAAELTESLRAAGWLEADVRVVVTPTGNPGLVVTAGERALVESWRLSGNLVIPAERLLRELPRGVPLTRALLDRAAARLLKLYEAHGYPLATVFPRSVVGLHLEDQSVDSPGPQRYAVVLGIDEGEAVRVGFLDFAGAGSVSPRVLRRSARFAPGIWQPRRVEAWQRNLDASGLVRTVARELVAADDGYGLRFQVRPVRANRATGAVGYDAEAAELAGFAHLALHNIANTGRRLSVTWESYREQVRYGLEYTEPWVFGSDLNLNAVARHRSQDTTAGRTEFELSVVFPAGAELELWLGSGYEQVTGIDREERARTAWGMTGLNYDSRSPRVNPETGLLFGLRTRVGTRQGADAARFIGRIEADFGLAGPGIGRFTLENRFQVRAVETASRLSELELYRLGGAGTVRGHREDAFIARRLGWSNSELRYRVERNSSVQLFFDAGAARQPDGWRFPLGYGVGARTGTRIGAFSAAYGLAPGVRAFAGKFHFRYEGDF